MGSQQDLDQGGTFRQKHRLYLGPSVGWVDAFDNAILPITAGGATTVLLGNTLILVNVNADVTLNLPSAAGSAAGAQALPGTFIGRPIVVVDTGGFAGAHNITIVPYGTEKIDGLASVQITVNYGALVLTPNTPNGGWTLTQ